MHDPTSVDHQSSFLENWWLLTGKLVVFSRLFYYKKLKNVNYRTAYDCSSTIFIY